ncbi:MAG: TniQ family protein, partial [Bacteroidota bacterium]
AESFVQVIEGLTLRQNLDRLTVMPLEAVAPTSGLLRRKLAWCPDCLNDWQQKVSLTYWPLLWSIKTVIVCPQHKQLLREVCPTCYCYQELLPSISNIGYCSSCGEWLSSNGEVPLQYKLRELKLKKELDWHLWVANSMGQLVSIVTQHKKIISKSSIKKNVLGNSNNLNISKYQLSDKARQEKRLNLNGLLKICYGTCIPIASLIFDEWSPSGNIGRG